MVVNTTYGYDRYRAKNLVRGILCRTDIVLSHYLRSIGCSEPLK